MKQAARLSGIAPGTWIVDPDASRVGFAVKHMLISTLKGSFERFEGTLEVDPGGLARASGSVEVESLNTGDETRDERVRASTDLFESDCHPLITFASSSIEGRGDRRFRMTGTLRMRGVARELSLDGHTRPSPGDDHVLSLTLTGTLDRKHFGITWSETLDSGGALVGNVVRLAMELRLRDAPGAAARAAA